MVAFDLSGSDVAKYHKFAPFAVFPEGVYNLSVSRQKGQFKLSAGHNPFSGVACAHHLGELCERYGGGGHKGVGAARFPDAESARRALAEIRIMLTA